MKTMKQILASFLVVAMLMAGIMIAPLGADASENGSIVKEEENGVIYVDLKFSDFWTTEEKTAPVRPGFVFGGWYTYNEETDTVNAIKESEVDDATTIEACAKFVPAEVLSVRAQLQIETEDGNGNTDSTYLRLLSAVNGLDYQKVGFDIYYNKKHHETQEAATNITKVFSKITNDETGADGVEANKYFGAAATHFSVLRLADIEKQNYEYVIYVTPQWTTLDGTLVEGQGKYVRIMDGYANNHYISVPVNFLTGSAVAAGQMEMTYDDSSLEVVGFDAGTIMPQMTHSDDKAGTVKIVGNIGEGTGVEPDTAIYANVWFKVKSGANVEDTTLKFEMKKFSFANWNEDFVDNLEAWDYKYLK